MNLLAEAPLWLFLLFAAGIIAGAVEDGMRLRISNFTSLALVAGAVVAVAVEGPSWALWQNLIVFAVVLLLGTIAFSAGWLGGGDVKLFAAAALWFDLRSAIGFVSLVFVAGGVVAICYLLARPFRKRLSAKSKGVQVPYGVAIAAGALAMAFLDRGTFRHHHRPLPPIVIKSHRLG